MSSEPEQQLAAAVLMIRPVRFTSNPMTAASNRFQGKSALDADAQNRHAQTEFDGLAALLRESGIKVIEIADTVQPHTPDSIFPNNWISFHGDGRVVLYPMEAENRRPERREDILATLVNNHGFVISEVVDLSYYEQAGQYLEGTGSLVLDRRNRIAYACMSSRTHLGPLGEFSQRLDYEVVAFDALDPDGVPIYHTNVVMHVGEKLAVICAEAIADRVQREAVLRSLESNGHEIMTLTHAQLAAFAGNMLELRTLDGTPLIALSQQAHAALSDAQRAQLQNNARVVTASIPVIEASAGGSVRCMLAEIHLPTANTL